MLIIHQLCQDKDIHFYLSKTAINAQKTVGIPSLQFVYTPVNIEWEQNWKNPEIYFADIYILPCEVYLKNEKKYQNQPETCQVRVKLQDNSFLSNELWIPYQSGKYEKKAREAKCRLSINTSLSMAYVKLGFIKNLKN